MLEQLLKALARGRTYSLELLAREQGVSPALVEQMLSDLDRAGLVEVIDLGCDGECKGCSASGMCSLMQGGRVWRLTERGRAKAGLSA